MCFAQIILVFLSPPPHFELMMVEHKQNILKTDLEALGETACYCPLSTLDAAIIVFYIEINCLHLIVC